MLDTFRTGNVTVRRWRAWRFASVHKLPLALSLAALLLAEDLASAGTYYVATTGSDSNPGTLSQPLFTLSRAMSKLAPGDTLMVRSGTYNQSAYIAVSGTASSPLTICGYPGETAIIDGNYTLPGTSTNNWWDALFNVEGDYVIVSNLTVMRSFGLGVACSGLSDQLLGVTSALHMDTGISIGGSGQAFVANCSSLSNCQENVNFSNSRGVWGAGVGVSSGGAYTIFSNNIIVGNWGEGLSASKSSNITMVANTIYNSGSANVYLQGSHDCRVERNLIYFTPGYASQTVQMGIELGNEQANLLCYNNTIINNLVLGGWETLYAWMNYGSPTINTVIAFNTFANASGDYNVKLSVTNNNTVFENNIILQSNSLSVGYLLNGNGLTISHNLWSSSPRYSLLGTGDSVGNPQLAMSGSIGPGQLTAQWFQLLPGSPARGSGVAIPGIAVDYFGITRANPPDIGACSYIYPIAPPTGLRIVNVVY